MKRFLTFLIPTVGRHHRKALEQRLVQCVEFLDDGSSVTIDYDVDAPVTDIQDYAVATSMIVEVFANFYGVSSQRFIAILRREQLRAVRDDKIFDDGAEHELLGIGLINPDRSTWFYDESYRQVIATAIDDIGPVATIASLMAVAYQLAMMLQQQLTDFNIFDVVDGIDQVFTEVTGRKPRWAHIAQPEE